MIAWACNVQDLLGYLRLHDWSKCLFGDNVKSSSLLGHSQDLQKAI
jgi:hypothetical protein